MKVYEFRGDWFTAEDAETRRYPHDIAGRPARRHLHGRAVVVRSVWEKMAALPAGCFIGRANRG